MPTSTRTTRRPARRLVAALLAIPAPLAASAQTAPIPPVGGDAFPGTIALAVDATDTEHRIMRVVETIPVAPGHLVLFYPQWLPGTHSPSARLDQLSGLECADGTTPPARAGESDPHRVGWTRDPVNVWAFHFDIPTGTSTLTCRFDYLSPLDPQQGREVMTPAIVGVQWNTVLLYPASYDASRIRFKPRLTLPSGFSFATALATDRPPASYPRTTDGPIDFAAVDLETLVDSPLFSGRYMKTFDLDPGGRLAVRLNVVADREANLDASPDAIEAHRRLVREAYKLFGSQHYAQYDFLFALSDSFGGIGLEHHQSSENGVRTNYFTDWKTSAASRALLPHEYTHSWNGKFRRPADLTTPNFNVPMQDSLLWVYEGQTDYWGNVLAARAGLVDATTARDVFAAIAATFDTRSGRVWRNLQDTTNQPIVGGRADTEWSDWLRGADYYPEMDLVWLDVDTKIRELSGGRKSLDDFARRFFGVDDGRVKVETYTFDDVVATLNAIQPFDWKTMLRTRLDGHGPGGPLDGLTRSGWQLVFDDKESEFLKSQGMLRHTVGFGWSLGFDVSGAGDRYGAGRITNVHWNGPGFDAGLTGRMTIVAVNSRSYSADLLKEAVRSNADGRHPIALLVKSGDYYRTVTIDYRGGLRYPHLVRIDGKPDMLSQILAAKK